MYMYRHKTPNTKLNTSPVPIIGVVIVDIHNIIIVMIISMAHVAVVNLDIGHWSGGGLVAECG
jgi:hypothetical protein